MKRALLTELMMQVPYQPATNYWRAIEIEEVIRYGLPTGRGLDLGCGDGHLMAVILSHSAPRDITGVDIDPKETALAARRNIYREVVTAAGDQIALADRQFDFVFSNSVLEHIKDIDGTLAEVARLLRPTGQFIFTVPGPDFHFCLRGSRFASRDAYLRAVDARCAHLRYWSPIQWAEHLERVGLSVVHYHGYLTRRQTQRWEQIARYTSEILYSIVKRRRQPIEIQRGLRLRSTRLRLPRLVASTFATLMSIGMRPEGAPYGCLLIEARKQ